MERIGIIYNYNFSTFAKSSSMHFTLEEKNYIATFFEQKGMKVFFFFLPTWS